MLYLSAGYAGSNDFNTGITHNTSILTWTGLEGKENYDETYSSVYESSLESIFFDLKKTKQINTYLHQKEKHTDKESVHGQVDIRRSFPFGLCNVWEGKPLRYLRITLRKSVNMKKYYVFVSDPAATTSFQLPYSLLTGDKIQVDVPPAGGSYASYKIQLKETSVEINDGLCTNYPTSRYQSYPHCVDLEIRRKVMPTLGKYQCLLILV